MTLLKTSLLSALAVLTKLATLLYLNKVLAVYVGPAGYAVIGQFQSLITLVTTFASGALNNGVTKYTAEYAQEPERQRRLWSTAATLGLLGALGCGSLLILAHGPLSQWLLGDNAHSSVMVWLGLALALLVMNALMLAILNGRKAVRELTIANIAGSLLGAVLATALVFAGGLGGALLALVISPAAGFLLTAWLFRRNCRVPWRELIGTIDPAIARSLGGFALMAATAALVGPLGQMVIRDRIAQDVGWNGAGLWQALWKISETHLLLLTSTLSVYFLPRFSEIRSGEELSQEVLKGYRFVLPITVASAIGLYWFREALVRWLLSPDFMPLTEALGIQLIGDVLKACSWIMSFTMISHARTRIFIATEILFTGVFVVATVHLTSLYGLQGAALAYAGTYALYWATMAWFFRGLVSSLRKDSASPSSGS